MLTGRVPFRGETPMAVALQHVQSPCHRRARRIRTSRRRVSAVLTRALAKEPGARYPTGAAFAAALAQAVDEAERKARGQWSRLFAGWGRADAGRPGPPVAPIPPPGPPRTGAPR